MPESTQARQLVVFTLGAEQYALPIQQVHEIIRYAEPRSVASRVAWVRGVISLRGRIIPVYDLAARLGVASELTEQTKIVIVEAGTETAGVIVDDVEEVLTVEDEQIEDVPGADADVDRFDRQGRRPLGRAAQAELDLRRDGAGRGGLSAVRGGPPSRHVHRLPHPRRRRRRQRADAAASSPPRSRRPGSKVVGSARDGDEALALCAREQPDALTLDLAMPGLDGLGVLRALRRRGGDSTPVVVVSAFSPAHGARAVDALAEGAFDLVAKPAAGAGLDHFTEDLIAKVRLAAASRRANGGRHGARPPRAARLAAEHGARGRW